MAATQTAASRACNAVPVRAKARAVSKASPTNPGFNVAEAIRTYLKRSRSARTMAQICQRLEIAPTARHYVASRLASMFCNGELSRDVIENSRGLEVYTYTLADN